MKIISLGLGLQSTMIYLASSIGEMERADFAIFADPGAEKAETYRYLEWLKDWARKNNGIPLIPSKRKNPG